MGRSGLHYQTQNAVGRRGVDGVGARRGRGDAPRRAGAATRSARARRRRQPDAGGWYTSFGSETGSLRPALTTCGSDWRLRRSTWATGCRAVGLRWAGPSVAAEPHSDRARPLRATSGDNGAATRMQISAAALAARDTKAHPLAPRIRRPRRALGVKYGSGQGSSLTIRMRCEAGARTPYHADTVVVRRSRSTSLIRPRRRRYGGSRRTAPPGTIDLTVSPYATSTTRLRHQVDDILLDGRSAASVTTHRDVHSPTPSPAVSLSATVTRERRSPATVLDRGPANSRSRPSTRTDRTANRSHPLGFRADTSRASAAPSRARVPVASSRSRSGHERRSSAAAPSSAADDPRYGP